MTTRKALITGITGQDGSYLAELLLQEGYEVHGMVRRSSTEKFDRIDHLRHLITLHQGDLLDQRSLVDTLRACQPHEIYNLAAMSYVAASWVQPTLTAEFTGTGVTRILEAMREVSPEARFYQASSSEMFGKVLEIPQTESTPFYPRSPYGVAKVYGHFITVNYRESYDLHATSGILFNHECLSTKTPLIVREQGIVSVKTPADLVPLREKGTSVQSFVPDRLLEVWDGETFTHVTAITATRRRATDPDHRLLSIEARGGQVTTTAHHTMLDGDRESLRADQVDVGDHLALAGDFPVLPAWSVLTEEMAELLGLLCADGWVQRDGHKICFTNNDGALRARVAQLWSRCFLKGSHEWTGRSGFSADAEVGKLNLHASAGSGQWLREQLYTPSSCKQVPPLVLNADASMQWAFLQGYYAGDGLKHGNGKAFKTNSAVLAQGLCWLYHLENQPASVYVERRGGATYYQVNLGSAVRVGMKGQHLRKDPAEVMKVVEVDPTESEWVFDLETESGVFCAGVGRLVVHNSPRRGLEFVTRKITWHAAAIKYGLTDELRLGNLEAKRDWGFAGDYVRAMWLMLQQDTPEDFVIATGETHSVRECLEIAFDHAGVSIDDHVTIDPALHRPAEVEHLIGDPTKAKTKLGWEPKVGFEELIRMMVDADLELLSKDRTDLGHDLR
ncbi:MAG TPA: GDP-mannose 4,6-dehydratase [Solirubrobacteraceae bacterium]|jgi:GDPmannose 4,6-dehydratase|nr:GDP-mannose 4,6-dehydratase [Solirubrobacteraceae bacterium]